MLYYKQSYKSVSKIMNANLNSLKLALRLAMEDENVTAYDVITTIRETSRELSQAHQVRSNKADAVCTGISLQPSSDSFEPYDDTMPSFDRVSGSAGVDTISFSSPQPAQQVSPYFGYNGGVDRISFS